AMEQDLVYLDEKLPGVPRQIVGNKADLLSEEILKETLEKCPIKPDIITSAKTGDHVESLFATLGELML
ncbi:MAG: 50S ribosomal subunit-associated GTPase HflX, partial [Limisphaerales bacterium]